MTAQPAAAQPDWAALPLIYFVRHGQTDWNAEGRLQGQSDIDLNARGRAQAQRNGERLAALLSDPGAFNYVSSPMRRARDTMQIVRAALGLPPDGYQTDPRLKEIHFGDWQGFTYPEMEARYPGFARMREGDKWNIVPPGTGAESYRDLAARVAPWLQSTAAPTVCVSHGGVMRSVVWLVAQNSDNAASRMEVPQDKVLRLQAGRFDWL